MTKEQEEQLFELVEKGLSQPEIGKIMNVHKVTVGRWCKKLGLKTIGRSSDCKKLEGKKSGKITFIKKIGKTEDRHNLWECSCECGNVISLSSSRFGYKKSCGECDKNYISDDKETKHKTKTRIYRLWTSMKNRCNNPHVNYYDIYGGRGIKVCDEWLNFDNFYNWSMNNGYNDNLSIDRINNNKDYSPSNCRWVTVKEQGRNKSTNYCIEYNGEIKCLSEWSEILRIPNDTLRRRIKVLGWSVDKAFTTPVAYRKNNRKSKE